MADWQDPWEEEAYSIAMLLREPVARVDIVPHIQIFATGIVFVTGYDALILPDAFRNMPRFVKPVDHKVVARALRT